MAGETIDLEVDEARRDELPGSGDDLVVRSLRWAAPSDPRDRVALDEHGGCAPCSAGALKQAAPQDPHGTTPTIRPRWVRASRVKTAVLSMLSTSFWTVPAFNRVEPAITSGPVSTSIAMSAARASGDPGLQVTATRSPPAAAARSSAPSTYAVRPLALIPTATSVEPRPAIVAAAKPNRRSASWSGSSAEWACTRSAATPKVAGHSAASS